MQLKLICFLILSTFLWVSSGCIPGNPPGGESPSAISIVIPIQTDRFSRQATIQVRLFNTAQLTIDATNPVCLVMGNGSGVISTQCPPGTEYKKVTPEEFSFPIGEIGDQIKITNNNLKLGEQLRIMVTGLSADECNGRSTSYTGVATGEVINLNNLEWATTLMACVKEQTASLTPQLPFTTPAASSTSRNSSTPTPTLAVDPSSIPPQFPTLSSMALWKENQSGFGIEYPADWKPGEPATPGGVRYEGTSGYFELKGIFQGDGRDADRDCTLEFFQNQDERYGTDPVKEIFSGHTADGSQISTCAVASKAKHEQHPKMSFVSIATFSKTPVLGYAVIETGGDAGMSVQLQHVQPAVTPTSPPPLPTSALDQPVQTTFGGFVMKSWVIAPQTNEHDNMYFMDQPSK